MKSCVMCAAAATHYCAQDDAFLCNPCNVSIHSANVLASRHKVVAIGEFQDAEGKGPGADVQSQGSTANVAAPSEQQLQHAHGTTPDSFHGSEGVVPCLGAETSQDAAPLVPGAASTDDFGASLLDTDFDLSKDDLFDLGSGWLEKLDAGFDFSGMFDDAGLVPTASTSGASGTVANNVVTTAAQVPTFSPVSNVHATVEQQVPHFQQQPSSEAAPSSPAGLEGFSLSMKEDDLDWLVPSFVAGEEQPLEQQQQQLFIASQMPPSQQQNAGSGGASYQMPAPLVKISPQEAANNRAERIVLFREKKKNRKFQKTIRYASRKAYAEVRPRIKGRFATPAEVAQMKADAAAAAGGDSSMEDAVVPCC